jgi:hypothetical protein
MKTQLKLNAMWQYGMDTFTCSLQDSLIKTEMKMPLDNVSSNTEFSQI